jgi:hypothetical protein
MLARGLGARARRWAHGACRSRDFPRSCTCARTTPPPPSAGQLPRPTLQPRLRAARAPGHQRRFAAVVRDGQRGGQQGAGGSAEGRRDVTREFPLEGRRDVTASGLLCHPRRAASDGCVTACAAPLLDLACQLLLFPGHCGGLPAVQGDRVLRQRQLAHQPALLHEPRVHPRRRPCRARPARRPCAHLRRH